MSIFKSFYTMKQMFKMSNIQTRDKLFHELFDEKLGRKFFEMKEFITEPGDKKGK